ncbi:PEPxxWA-CTERM sorting domain-containing protein [Sphingomonas sp. AP4-R1]|uniref:PEPxxWA-CTERM sorting domain-containing protein n=1 Tax=Sphingomonas sp. AP4-R1 TaxID=2735134 RepID=UPI0020A4D050|nr:PEPxxWA-CTERM sorting domain-containing protein [Sphingomonas sp. AP4-R1]
MRIFLTTTMSVTMAMALLAASAAPAAVITRDYVFDLGTATASGAYTYVQSTDGPLTVSAGDTLQGTVSFLGGPITLTNDPTSPGPGYELVGLNFYSNGGTTTGTSVISLTGISGDYTGLASYSGATIGGLFASAFNDLTPTAFSFTGLTYSLSFESGTATSFRAPQLELAYDARLGGAPASDVPEPAIWAMMLAGFGAMGASMRKRRLIALDGSPAL